MKRSGIIACSLLLLLTAANAQATEPEIKCQQSKLKAQGKLKFCLKKSAAAVLGGKPDESAECRTKFQEALDKADTKAAAAGSSCRYIDNGNETVSDLDTGLMWEKKSLTCPGPNCYTDRFTWSKPLTPADGPWIPDGSLFFTFLEGLNNARSSDGITSTGCFAGHCDWRIPTVDEMMGVFPAFLQCTGDPCIAPVFGVVPTELFGHWTSTHWSDLREAEQVYNFGGTVRRASSVMINEKYARAVRGGF